MRPTIALTRSICIAAPAFAALGAGPPSAGDGGLVSVRLLSEASRIGPGQKFHLAVVFTIQPKWHIYWKDPGEGTLAPRVNVKAPPGFEVGAPLWPRPVTLRGPIGPEYCYLDQAVLFVPLTAPAALGDGTAELEAEVNWAVCKEICRLGSARPTIQIETSVAAAPAGKDPLFQTWWRRLPVALAKLPGATLSFDGRTLLLEGPAAGRTTAALLPAVSPGLTLAQPKASVRGDRFRLSVRVEVEPQNATGPMGLRGLVTLGESPDDPCYDFELPIQADQPGEPGRAHGGEGS